MLPPRLREEITIQQNTGGRDAGGGVVENWIDFAALVPAEAAPLSGAELVRAAQISADISIRFRCRYIAGVNPAMRVAWRDAYYGIVRAINIGARDRELEILCSGAAQDA